MSTRVFNIDFNKLVLLLLPSFLRTRLRVYWLQGAILPLAVIYADFINNRANNLYKLAHNGQVCYLRKVLNDTFDPDQRRIYITDGNRYKRQYIYTNPEQQPKHLGTMYLRQNSDFGDTGVDFRVIVPAGFELGSYAMRSVIEYYKIASKRYIIAYE